MKITFKDVAGVEEAKSDLAETIEFLKDPTKFRGWEDGSQGNADVVASGTGKLYHKGVAEADVPFFSMSGSDFVEMFVGIGASRVRDLFEEGRRNAPCILFIDEIDAVGRSREPDLGGTMKSRP